MAVPGGPTFRRVSLLRLLVIVLVMTVAPLAARGVVDISTEGRNINVTAPAVPATTNSPVAEALPATPDSLGGSSRPDATTTSTSSTSSTTSTTVEETTTTPAPPETTTTTVPPSTAPSTTPPDDNVALLAAHPELETVYDRVNQARAEVGCSPLDVDSRLVEAAQRHSDDMSARGYMDHTNPDGQDPGDRAAAAGYDGPVGENIAQGYTSADAVMDAWMASDGHRANIENCAYTIIGLGVATDGWSWTQVFGQ